MNHVWDEARPVVVCADDEEPVLRALARLLRDAPIDLRTTSEPDQALEWARSGDVALLIADDRMPGMRGTTLLLLAKAASPRTKRVLLTGHPDEDLVLTAGAAGLMDIIGKPWNDAALRELILERLSGR